MENQRTNGRTGTAITVGHMINPAMQNMAQTSSKRRKQMKPKYSRFKASIKYFDNPFSAPMYSYDWNKVMYEGQMVGKDNEEIGFYKLCKWIGKCMKDERVERVRIFITLRKDKRTDVMDYDLCVLDWKHSDGEHRFQAIRELKFDLSGKVMLHLLEGKGGQP